MFEQSKRMEAEIRLMDIEAKKKEIEAKALLLQKRQELLNQGISQEDVDKLLPIE